ncbi:MAG: 16S rRNA (cytidine(1402)-2'-O)-methyltransferase [Acholeplasmataceae bacterium]|nr:16S rRNA (cytidine(1402)-2'-O)-methyltransferase [Acholeplasmataceae bacterium]
MIQRSFKEKKPTLYVVATPIGNLEDMTLRAVHILESVDLILTEDTRTSGVLLNHYNIKKPLLSYHEFNKYEQEQKIIDLLNDNKNIALISDAGTPGISDPGYEIIVKVIENGFHVVSIPGASAILTALISSGLVMQPFTFIGFLPKKISDIKSTLDTYSSHQETLVIYESPNRIEKTLKYLFESYGNRRVVLARELTKAFETITRTTLKDAQDLEINTKGEYVIVLEGRQLKDEPILGVKEHYLLLIEEGYPTKDAMKMVAKRHKLTKSEVYRMVKIDDIKA